MIDKKRQNYLPQIKALTVSSYYAKASNSSLKLQTYQKEEREKIH